LASAIPIVNLSEPRTQRSGVSGELANATTYSTALRARLGKVSHLIAIERVGPSHADGRCRSMRGLDVTDHMSPVYQWFEPVSSIGITTIGIGDGGNEIGMGKIPWQVIERNIPNGRQIACRVPTDHLIVCGVSNWGVYALAAGIAHLRGERLDARLFDAERERRILEAMVKAGPLVDGVRGEPSATVDGLTWEEYADVLDRIKSFIV
jgi:hypothetical protein